MSRALYAIAAGAPFVDLLAQGLLRETRDTPEDLADTIVLLPTRRALRALREAFLRQTGGAPLLLPRMEAIGDVDDDELLLQALSGGEDAAPASAIGMRERLVVLTQMLRGRPEVAGNAALACRLAMSLASLLDSAALEEIDLGRLETLVAEDLAQHWQRSLDVLAVIQEAWPAYLAERGLVDPARLRVQRLHARAATWRARPPATRVIAAGSTGSIPATAGLLEVVADLPRGAVVLPGLDHDLDAESWAACAEDPAHPQHGLARLLARLGVTRDQVAPWPGSPSPHPRARMLGEALRPAKTTPAWSRLPLSPVAAFAGLARIEAPAQQDEALAIALVLREAIETPARTAALITPDRQLARRVTTQLARWGLTVDDSGGTPLLRTTPGSFLRACAAWAADPAAPIALLSALKHPLASGGAARATFLRQARRLEKASLRGLRPAPGIAGVIQAVRDGGDGESLAFVERLTAALAPFSDALASPAIAPIELLDRHIAFMEWLAADETGAPAALWSGDAGESLREALLDLGEALAAMAPIVGRQWPSLVEALLDDVVVRPRLPAHPRLAIWGPLEARLQSADIVVLGALNEGVWPPDIGDDPWLSRPMRAALGLPPAERRVGLSAHDFVQAAAHGEVVLSFSRKADGVPTTPSRWLQRLNAFLARHPSWQACIDTQRLAWGAALDLPGAAKRIGKPAPRPPVAARPRRLAVTAIETLVRDPYSIFARRILALDPLDPLDQAAGAAERGTIVHAALGSFLEELGGAWPADPLVVLLAHGRRSFGSLLDRPVVRAVWWPRFERLAEWFVSWEARRRAMGLQPLGVEVKGVLDLDVAEGFRLEARADRIDHGSDGALSVIDYKTGRVPSDKEIAVGFAPQLALEAAIAMAGGFTGVAAATVGELLHVRLTGGDPAGIQETVLPKRDKVVLEPATLAAEARAGLERLIRRYADPATPYLARPRVQFIQDRGRYDHLARIAEWSAGGDEG